jgi:uncharacterized membrane protein YraQ (UPF0718 family)
MALSIKDLFRQDETWVFLFLLGVALLNWPLLSLATGMAEVFGYPSILLYLALVWLLIILFAYLFDRRGSS